MFPLHDDNPCKTTPFVNYALIVTCIVVFVWQLSLGPNVQKVIFSLGMIPSVLFGIKELPTDLAIVPDFMTLFTSMFLHGGWMHIIGNMLFLWIFGDNVEDAMGHKRYLLFYLLCGVAAAMAQALPNPASQVPMIGASGAISGVLGAYLLLYPHARVLVAIPIGFFIHTTRIPAGWALGLWFGLQLLNSYLSAGQEAGVAWSAHIGGFIAGLLFVLFFKKKHVKLFAPPRQR